MMHGPAVTPQTYRGYPSLSHHPASPPVSRSPFLASPTSPPARPVRRQPRRALRPPAHHHPAWPPREDGRARWTPRSISARIRTVRIRAGSGGAISVPMDFLPFVNPNLSIFTPSARLAHDEFGWHHSPYDDAAWPQEYAAVGRQYCVKPGHGAAPLLATSSTRC